MAAHNDLGKIGEELALEHLRNNGFEIVETNWRNVKEEVDIVALKDGFLVFVEVKTRSHDLFETPESTVTKKKQRLLIFAADAYIKKRNIGKEARFDIIFIIHNPSMTKLTHIEEAFYPTL